MIYTSYYGKIKELKKAGIIPIAISRGKPKWFRGEAIDSLAPTWDMIKLDWPEYEPRYRKILQRNNADHIVRDIIGNRDVALLCYEKNIEDCHRKYIRQWLIDHGYPCEEFSSAREILEPDQLQLAF